MRKHSVSRGSVLSTASVNSLDFRSNIFRTTKSINIRKRSVMGEFNEFAQNESEALVRYKVKPKVHHNLSQVVEHSKPMISK
jgi:hypothetical protein